MALGVLTAAFAAVSTTTIFAQDQTEKQALYAKFTECYKKTTDKVSVQCALDTAKEYISKYNTEADKPQVDYFQQTAIPFLEKQIAKMDAEKVAQEKAAETQARYKRFDTATSTKNVSEVTASAKDILAAEPDFLDVNIVLATTAYDKAFAKDPTAYDDAINYAQKSLSLINSGKESTSKSYGAYTYSYGDKNNAVGWLNYYIGYVKFYGQDKKKEALPYLYKATQTKSKIQDFSDPYRMIGEYYYQEAGRIDKERKAAIEANNNEDNEQSLNLLAMQNGNIDRALDAYSRAYKFAQANKDAKPEYKTGLYNTLKSLYTFRFNNSDGLDAYITSATTKTQPDPTTDVQPVVEAKKDTATTPSTTPPTTDKPMMTKPPTPSTSDKPMTKPATMDKPTMDKPATKPPTAAAPKTKTTKPSHR